VPSPIPFEAIGERAPWRPSNFSRAELADALIKGRVAGPVTSHDRRNVLAKIERLVFGDPEAQFGIRGLTVLTPDEVLAVMAEESGFDPDPLLMDGPSAIDPYRVLQACERAGDRLALAAKRGERVLLATGHPAGLILLYQTVGSLLEEGGAKLLRPLSGHQWKELGRHREIRYLQGVAVLTDRGSTKHTHAPVPMEWMLREVQADLVFADHGFAGAAIEAGAETISIADVNDPAPVVAKHLGMTDLVIVMDDNVQPEDYWPCFQAIAARFP
jgi:hypothetical protein